MDADYMIELAARCQRVAILSELIRIRQARAAALKGLRSATTLPKQNFSVAAGGGFKSPAPGASTPVVVHNSTTVLTESNPAAGGRGVSLKGKESEEDWSARPWPPAEQHNRFSRGRW